MFFGNSLPSTTATMNINIIPGDAMDIVSSASGLTSIPQPIDINHQRSAHSMFNNGRFRRESLAHSQGIGGVSWGSVTIGSWLKDEVMMSSSYNQNSQLHNQHGQYYAGPGPGTGTGPGSVTGSNLINPRRGLMRYLNALPPAHASYMPDLEADFCRDYLCCGEHLPTLHDLLRHYEEAHISASPPTDAEQLLNTQRNNHHLSNMHNIMETVSTNDVFLNNPQGARLDIHDHHPSHRENVLPHHQQQPPQHQQHPPHHQQQHQQRRNIAPQRAHNQSNQPPFDGDLLQVPSSNRDHLTHNGQMGLPYSSPQNQVRPTTQRRMNIPHPSNRLGMPMSIDDDEANYIGDPARHLYVMENDEHKPYKCPVIGCEKTYKNQNGLKYHRLHGHQGQTLKENTDGTISIIDPESNTPYLDGAGMEKDKPYRCEVCGKRYKNLNGLKYHRGHTTH